MEPASAEVIGPAFEHGEAELHRQNLFEYGQVFLRELLLQIDGVGADNRLLLVRDGVDAPLAKLFVHAARKFEPDAEGVGRARYLPMSAVRRRCW